MSATSHGAAFTRVLARVPAVIAALVLTCSCVYPRTQIAIFVETDMPQFPSTAPGALTSVRLQVFYPSDSQNFVGERNVTLGRSLTGDPITLPRDLLVLYPQDNGRAPTSDIPPSASAHNARHEHWIVLDPAPADSAVQIVEPNRLFHWRQRPS